MSPLQRSRCAGADRVDGDAVVSPSKRRAVELADVKPVLPLSPLAPASDVAPAALDVKPVVVDAKLESAPTQRTLALWELRNG